MIIHLLRRMLGILVIGCAVTACGGHHHEKTKISAVPFHAKLGPQFTACVGNGCGIYAAALRWHVTWPGHTATGYYPYKDGIAETSGGNPVSTTSTIYIFKGLDCGTTYTLGVRAHDSATPTPNESAINQTTYTTPACPGTTSTTTSTTTSSSSTSAACTTNVTTSTFASAVSASSNGDVLCLANGAYGAWAGVSKTITLQPQSGATPTMQIDDEAGASGFTINGMGGMAGEIDTPAANITIKNSTFTDSIVINNIHDGNIVFDHDSFNSEDDNADCSDDPARIHLAYNDGEQSGVTVENSSFIDPPGGLDNAKDGIQTGEGMTVKNNSFVNIVAGPGCNHQDALQGLGTDGMVVTGNLFVADDDGFANFDGVSNATVTDNACIEIGRSACITLYSDTDSTVNHNTMATSGEAVLELDHKDADPAGTGTVVENNVGPVFASDGSTMATDTHNLYSGATSPDINGSPTFAGGSSPSTWPGFELTSGSAGHNAATDGSDVGIRASAGGPPS